MEQQRHVFRFADFEADLDRFQLLSGHQSIKLERIPLDLLFLLLSENGHLVSREEIIARLWGDVFLDTERAVNTAVRKIRKALGDNADHPQFIETVVGKGYRFIAPLIQETAIQNPESTTQAGMLAMGGESDGENTEIRLRSFSVETRGGMSVVTCDVIVGNMVLGRLPLLEVEFPDNVILSRKPHDNLPPKLLGARLTLTTKAAQALYASSTCALQGGLRSNVTDSLNLGEVSGKELSSIDSDTNDSLCAAKVIADLHRANRSGSRPVGHRTRRPGVGRTVPAGHATGKRGQSFAHPGVRSRNGNTPVGKQSDEHVIEIDP